MKIQYLYPLVIFVISLSLTQVSCVTKDLTISSTTSTPSLSTAKPISSLLVGTNVWYKRLPDEVWDLTAQSGVKSIRIGGHSYDRKMPALTQLLDWVKKIQSIGAEPIIQVSQYAPPEAAAEIVKYFNIELASGKPIKYWNIGNEPWLQNDKPELSKVGEMVEGYFKPRAIAMKKIDSSIKIYGPDFCYYIESAMNDLFGGKNDIAGKVPGEEYYYCDGISWHRYPQKEDINLAYEGIEDFRKAIEKCKARVDLANSKHKRFGENKLGWGIGEYNAKGGPQVHTWANGQMFGGVLGLCMKYEATYATSWSMFEHDGNRKGTDFSFIDGANMIPRSTYRHMQMVAKHFSGHFVEGKSSLSDVITFGSVDKNKICVLIMNRTDEEIKFDLGLDINYESQSDCKAVLNIDADSQISLNQSIEPQSTQTLIFQGNKITQISYSIDHFQKELPPVEIITSSTE